MLNVPSELIEQVEEEGAVDPDDFATIVEASFPGVCEAIEVLADHIRDSGRVVEVELDDEDLRAEFIEAFATTPVLKMFECQYDARFFLVDGGIAVAGIPESAIPSSGEHLGFMPWRQKRENMKSLAILAGIKRRSNAFLQALCLRLVEDRVPYVERRLPIDAPIRRDVLEILAIDAYRCAFERAHSVEFGFIQPDRLLVRHRERPGSARPFAARMTPLEQILVYDRTLPRLAEIL